MTDIMVIGSCGAIGKRYVAILNYLGKGVVECDTANKTESNIFSKVDGIIVATPTTTHAKILDIVLTKHDKIPILCEKPICANKIEAQSIINTPSAKDRLSVVDNWVHMLGGFRKNYNITYKNYFAGKECLAFNMAQPIYLSSRGKFKIDLKYPYFEALVDKTTYYSDSIDRSYVSMLTKWLRTKHTSFGTFEALEMQECVEDMI